MPECTKCLDKVQVGLNSMGGVCKSGYRTDFPEKESCISCDEGALCDRCEGIIAIDGKCCLGVKDHGGNCCVSGMLDTCGVCDGTGKSCSIKVEIKLLESNQFTELKLFLNMFKSYLNVAPKVVVRLEGSTTTAFRICHPRGFECGESFIGRSHGLRD